MGDENITDYQDKLQLLREEYETRHNSLLEKMELLIAEDLLHDLHLNKLELEMQNKKLLQVQSALRNKEEHLRLSQIGGGIGTWEADLINNKQIWSDNCIALLGFSAIEEPTFEDFLELIIPEDRQIVIDATQSHIEHGTKYDVEYRVIHANGEIRWMRSAGQVERNNIGKPVLMRGIAQDITERKLSESLLEKARIALEESRSRYLDLYEFAPVGYLSISNQGLIMEVNWKMTTMFGLKRNQLLQELFAKFVEDEDKDRWHRQFVVMKEFSAGEELSFDMKFSHENGSIFHANLNCLRMDDVEDESMLRLTLVDITQIKQSESALSIAATIFESHEGMLVTDAKGHILRVNHSFTTITGYTAKEVLGKNPSILSSGKHDAAFYTEMWNSIKESGRWEGEIWNKRKNGEIYPELLTISTVNDRYGIVCNYVATLADITSNNAATEEIKSLAFYDPLTKLPNRRLLLDRLKHSLAASEHNGQEGAVLFLDLDHFKTLNDTQGHDIGDLLLQQVSARLTACVRESDTVARLGGDEFVVLLEALSSIPSEAAMQTEVIANKILSVLNQPYQLGTHKCYSSPSIGVAIFNDHQLSIEELLKQADIAMYQAKVAGRSTIRFFNPEMQDAINNRASLEADLRLAIEKQHFILYYQVQVDSTNQPLGAEALIRWIHPERGMVSPINFIPLAEETGLILSIGLWVLKAACIQLKAWEQDPLTRHLTISINVSAKQFSQVEFVKQVQITVQRYAIKPMLLKLELTESMLLDNIEHVIITMVALETIGVQFSLDDFGTGYSSLQYLKMLPMHQLKIDQSFVRDIVTDNNDKSIVRTIIAMAKTLGMDVIAEGVETEGQRELLINKGCPKFQGYLFGKPVPIEVFEAELKKF